MAFLVVSWVFYLGKNRLFRKKIAQRQGKPRGLQEPNYTNSLNVIFIPFLSKSSFLQKDEEHQQQAALESLPI